MDAKLGSCAQEAGSNGHIWQQLGQVSQLRVHSIKEYRHVDRCGRPASEQLSPKQVCQLHEGRRLGKYGL